MCNAFATFDAIAMLAAGAQRADEGAETPLGAVRHFCLSRHCSLVCFLNGFRLSDRKFLPVLAAKRDSPITD